MCLFQEATHLNNVGIATLLKGDQAAAIRLLAEAVRMLNAHFLQIDSDILEFQDCAEDDRIEHPCSVEIRSMKSSDTIVFNHAFRIPAGVHDPTAFDVNVYIAAVIFNLALACHFKGSAGDAASIKKAEKLYSIVSKLLVDDTLYVRTALVVKLASINNLSQIRFAKGDYDHADEVWTEVSKVVNHSSNPEMFDEPDIQGLLMNVLLLKAPTVASAA